jgi:hypothetical protein
MSDMQEAKRLEDLWKQEAAVDQTLSSQKKISRLLEAVIADQVNTNQWMGEGAETLPITPFDDYINKIDIGVEFASGQVLGLDATYSFDVAKKFNFIKDRIKRDVLGSIKYFESQKTPSKYKASNVPIAVVGVEPHLLAEMAPAWIRNPESLNKHKSQLIILEQIYEQLTNFERFAKKINRPKSVESLDAMIAEIEPLLETKRKLINIPKTELLLNDRVFLELHLQTTQILN